MNSVCSKTIAISIILLFITSVIPVSLGIGNKINSNDEKDECYSTLDLDQNISDLMRQSNIPSVSACIIKNDEVVWSRGYGYYNRLRFWKKPDGDTIYGTGCVTTTVTVTALLQLYEKGLFNLSDDVNDYLDFNLRNPNYPDIPINFTMLLTHQSSLCEYLPGNIFIPITNLLGFPKHSYYLLKEFLVPGSRFYKPEAWLNVAPGEGINYSCVAFRILAYIVERLSGQSFGVYCKENIFEPLNMDNTGFYHRKLKRKNLAVPYFPLSISFFNKKRGMLIRLPRMGDNMPGTNGLLTTTDDLSHFLIAHMNGGVWNGNRILNESTVELMHTIRMSNLSMYFWAYGLGWGYWIKSGTIYQGYAGSDLWGFSAYMGFNESDKLGAIIFISSFTSEQAEFRALIRKEILKKADEL